MRPHTLVRWIGGAVALSGCLAAQAVPVTLVHLTGLVGDPGAAGTAVYKADLSSLAGLFSAISISDQSGGFGGATGQFSGFDLDAIKLSTTNCATAACAASAVGINVFDFLSGVVFAPGSQRTPVDAKLFGTSPSGTTVNNAVATLGSFDGFSSTLTPNGFVSLGDFGSIGFNLSSALSGAGLFLYIGEVGDNGEVAGSSIQVLSAPIPEPGTYALTLAGLGVLGWVVRRRQARRN